MERTNVLIIKSMCDENMAYIYNGLLCRHRKSMSKCVWATRCENAYFAIFRESASLHTDLLGSALVSQETVASTLALSCPVTVATWMVLLCLCSLAFMIIGLYCLFVHILVKYLAKHLLNCFCLVTRILYNCHIIQLSWIEFPDTGLWRCGQDSNAMRSSALQLASPFGWSGD